MKKRIYVVEDNEDIRELIEYLLVEANYAVYGYGTANALKNKLQKGGDKPDLIILDVMLPDGNGIDLCDQLKGDENTFDIPVLLMSAHASLNSVKHGKAEDFITKPFDIDDFIERVQRYT